jgi:hypothetical protein
VVQFYLARRWSWDPTLMQLFLDGGADVVTEYPFTMAFSEKIRTALNRFVVYKRSHPELDLELQEQVDRALRFFAREGNLKWVSLLMWAGGDPEHWLAATRERASGARATGQLANEAASISAILSG